MNKTRRFENTYFSVEVIDKAIDKLKELADISEINPNTMMVDFDDEDWQYDNISEFFADYIKNPQNVTFNIYHKENGFSLRYSGVLNTSTLGVNGKTRNEIEQICNVFESSAENCRLPEPDKVVNEPTIFIGHGRKEYWTELANHLNYKHGYKIEAYETGARAGHTIRDILESMLKKSSFALLVLTGEDIMDNDAIRARQNVIHEVGLFQGRLGFNRALMIVEEGVENFSNVDGIQQIRFSKGNIKETFGEIIATIKREFGE